MLELFRQNYFELYTILESLVMLAGMLACMEAGSRFAVSRGDNHGTQGITVIEGAVFALLGLLIAFTFSGASDRMVHRNLAAVEEASLIRTAWERLRVLPQEEHARISGLLLSYAEARSYEYAHRHEPSSRTEAETDSRRDLLWDESVKAGKSLRYQDGPLLLLQGLNAAFEAGDRRRGMRHIHPHTSIYALLFCVAMLSAGLAGFGLAERRGKAWLHRLSFALVTVITFFLTVNMERPLLGFLSTKELKAPLKAVISEMQRGR